MENEIAKVSNTLYDINILLAQAWNELVDQETGEVLDASKMEIINKLEIEKDDKIKSCVYIYKTLQNRVDEIAKEISRLEQLKSVCENNQKTLKQYLSDNMKSGTRYQNGTIDIGWRYSESVEIEDENKIPNELKKLVPEHYEVSKTNISEKIKEDEETKKNIEKAKEEKKPYTVLGTIAGAKLVAKQNIQIC